MSKAPLSRKPPSSRMPLSPSQEGDADAPSSVIMASAYDRIRITRHSIWQRSARDDDASFSSYSTNSTTSNLIGVGRTLGNFYSFTGKHLEKRLGDFAHRAGFGPEAIYQTIRALYSENWKNDKKKGEVIIAPVTISDSISFSF